jgi:hypothetical protein
MVLVVPAMMIIGRCLDARPGPRKVCVRSAATTSAQPPIHGKCARARGWDHPVASDGTTRRVAPWGLITESEPESTYPPPHWPRADQLPRRAARRAGQRGSSPMPSVPLAWLTKFEVCAVDNIAAVITRARRTREGGGQ